MLKMDFARGWYAIIFEKERNIKRTGEKGYK